MLRILCDEYSLSDSSQYGNPVFKREVNNLGAYILMY